MWCRAVAWLVFALLLNTEKIETSENSALLVVGGLSQISVDRVDNYGRSMSPVIREAELVSCPAHANQSRHLPDYPQEMFGGQSTWLGDRLLVCGGANWTSSHDQCHSWSPRLWDRWTPAGTLNHPRAFGYMAFLPEPMCKTEKLFILGGLDSVSLAPVLTTEVYDADTRTWLIHKQLPTTSDKNLFVNRADSGCISSVGGTVYSVGEEIIALDWVSLSLSVLARTRASALAEGCVSLTLPGNDTGFFFLSGDFYSLDTHTWTRFARPEPAFNMFSLDNVPVILGIATLDPTSGCDDDDDESEGAGCHPTRMLTGDNRVVQFNLQSNSWTNIAYLDHSRLGYSSATAVPGHVCLPHQSQAEEENLFEAVHEFWSAEETDSEVEDAAAASTSSSLPLREENSLKLSAAAIDVQMDANSSTSFANSSNILRSEKMAHLRRCIFALTLITFHFKSAFNLN